MMASGGAGRAAMAMSMVLLLLWAGVSVAGLQRKRQIFREQVLPHRGGKIPSDAFRADRLALNRLNKEGIAVPDGIVLDARRNHRHSSQWPNSDYETSVVKVLVTADQRYTAPEGYLHPREPITVDSTYIIRPPIDSYKSDYRRQPHIQPPGFRPSSAKSFVFQSSHGGLPHHLNSFYTPQTLSGLDAFFAEVRPWGDEKSFVRFPEASFRCEDRQGDRLYADRDTACQAFHVCQKDGRRDSFWCPRGTLFNELTEHCDWWYNVKCG